MSTAKVSVSSAPNNPNEQPVKNHHCLLQLPVIKVNLHELLQVVVVGILVYVLERFQWI